jgi:thiamine biosynthesis lipoprotein
VSSEANLGFRCFGGDVRIHLGSADRGDGVKATLERSRERLLDVHQTLSRFLPDSELSLLNAAAESTVKASQLMRLFARAAVFAGRRSGGLVDATLIGELERTGYEASREGMVGLPLRDALAAVAEPRRPASPNLRRAWSTIGFDDRACVVSRPPGLRLDSGGIAKGLAADLIAAGLKQFSTFAVDCAGDMRIGGTASLGRRVLVDDPFGGPPLYEFEIDDGAVATSGIGRRAWLGVDGMPAHHLLDPATGRPAFTGIVQVTALAPTAQLAEVLAKTALLRGPAEAASELPYGGCVVLDDGSHRIVSGSPIAVTLPRMGPRPVAA